MANVGRSRNAAGGRGIDRQRRETGVRAPKEIANHDVVSARLRGLCVADGQDGARERETIGATPDERVGGIPVRA